jgi:16S rRNA (uracil1498-N3)-methyltransferase
MIPRLYIIAPLEDGAEIPLTAAQAHYLKNVLRRAAGDRVFVFNGRDGEFAAEILALKKNGGLAGARRRTRAQGAEPDLQLLFALVKRPALEAIVQKATELGVARLTPIVTKRTVAAKTNLARLGAIAVEAAEQCGRLSVPAIDEPMKLSDALDAWPAERRLLYCDEAGDDQTENWGGTAGRAPPMLEILKGADGGRHSWALLIGPEGGFSPGERAALRARDFVAPATLGPRILRADTAAAAALALWQAACGDWRESVFRKSGNRFSVENATKQDSGAGSRLGKK